MSDEIPDYTTQAIDRALSNAQANAEAAHGRAETRNFVRRFFSDDGGYEKAPGTD